MIAPATWIVRTQAKGCCATCGAWTPLDGPDPAFVCRTCAQRTEIPAEHWRSALAQALLLGPSWEAGVSSFLDEGPATERLEATLRCSAWRLDPACPKCRRSLGGDALFATETACPGCGFLLPIEPSPHTAISPRLRWVLRVPRDPEDEEMLAEFERQALDAPPSQVGFEPESLPEMLERGDHVPDGVFWLGMSTSEQEWADARARVTEVLAAADAALVAAGVVPETPFPDLLDQIRAAEGGSVAEAAFWDRVKVEEVSLPDVRARVAAAIEAAEALLDASGVAPSESLAEVFERYAADLDPNTDEDDWTDEDDLADEDDRGGALLGCAILLGILSLGVAVGAIVVGVIAVLLMALVLLLVIV